MCWFTAESDIQHIFLKNSTLYETFEKMIECEEFSAFLTELVMVAAHVRPEETLAECEEEYELVLFQDYIEFQQYKL